MVRKNSVARLDLPNATARIGHDALHSTRARDVARDVERDGLSDALDVRLPVAGGDVFGSHRDDKRGRSTPERRKLSRGGRHRKRCREGIVPLLDSCAAISIGPIGKVGYFVGGGREEGPRCCLAIGDSAIRNSAIGDLGVQHAVENLLQLTGNLGEQIAAQRNDAVARDPESHTALSHRHDFARFSAILVEIHRPHRRLTSKVICARMRCPIDTVTASGCCELFIGGQVGSSPRCRHHPSERPGDRDKSVDSQISGRERRTHRGKLRGQHLTRDDGHRFDNGPSTLHEGGRRPRRHPGRALHELSDRTASEICRHALTHSS